MWPQALTFLSAFKSVGKPGHSCLPALVPALVSVVKGWKIRGTQVLWHCIVPQLHSTRGLTSLCAQSVGIHCRAQITSRTPHVHSTNLWVQKSSTFFTFKLSLAHRLLVQPSPSFILWASDIELQSADQTFPARKFCTSSSWTQWLVIALFLHVFCPCTFATSCNFRFISRTKTTDPEGLGEWVAAQKVVVFFWWNLATHPFVSDRKSWSKLWVLLQGELRFGLNRPNQGRHWDSLVLGMEEQWSRRWSCIVERGWPPWPSFQGNCKHGRCNHSQASSKKSWVESFSSFNWKCNGLAEVCYWAVCLTFVFPRASAVFKKKCPYFPFTNAWEHLTCKLHSIITSLTSLTSLPSHQFYCSCSFWS